MEEKMTNKDVFEEIIKTVFPNIIFSSYALRIKLMEGFYDISTGNEQIKTLMKGFIEQNKLNGITLEHPKFIGLEQAQLGETNIVALIHNFEDNDGIVKFILVLADKFNMHCMYIKKEKGIMKLYETFPNEERIRFWGNVTNDDYLKLVFKKSLLISVQAENALRFKVEQVLLREIIENEPIKYENTNDKQQLMIDLCNQAAKEFDLEHPYEKKNFFIKTTQHENCIWDFILMPRLIGTNWAALIIVVKNIKTNRYYYFLVEKSFVGYVLTNGQDDSNNYKIYASIPEIDLNYIIPEIEDIIQKDKIIEFRFPIEDNNE